MLAVILRKGECKSGYDYESLELVLFLLGVQVFRKKWHLPLNLL